MKREYLYYLIEHEARFFLSSLIGFIDQVLLQLTNLHATLLMPLNEGIVTAVVI